MSIGHAIPDMTFWNITLKIQGQGHGWGQGWKSQSVCNILSTHIPFIPCKSALPFLRCSIFKIWPWVCNFKIWPWKSKVKVTGEGYFESHNMVFKIWPWKFKVKVIVEVKVESHKVGVTSCGLTFLVPCQLALQFLRKSIFKIWPWKSKVKVMGEVDIESHNMGPTCYRLTSLWFYVNRPSHSWDTTFSKFDLENPRSKSWVRGTLKVTKWV